MRAVPDPFGTVLYVVSTIGIAREIKTARSFALVPFTTMGTKSVVYGKAMRNLDKGLRGRGLP